MRTRSLCLSLVIVATINGTRSIACGQTAAPFPVSIASVAAVGEGEEFGSIIAAKVGANGNVYALDHINARVTAFSPEGRVLWRAGRMGRGPGEFQLPYRLDVAPNGEIVVYDFGMNEVTTLSPAGRFVRRLRLPFMFRAVDNLVALADGELLISGYSAANERVSRFGIHRFRPRGTEMEYVSSFGPLPGARDREVLAHWGAGPIMRGSGCDLLYLRRLPYEIHRYNAAGRERATIRPPVPIRGLPDDFVRIERNMGGGTAISSESPNIDRPGSLVELSPGWVLVTRLNPRKNHWDLFNPAGRLIASRATPAEWSGLIGYDPVRRLIWLIGTHGDAPVLLRLTLPAAGADPRPRTRGRSR